MYTKLILTRHGHVHWIAPERFRGRADLQLSELGLWEAEATAERITSSWSPSAIYSSPMGRAVETAEFIARPHRLAVQGDPGLNDIDYGAWQGRTPAEAKERWPAEYAAWRHEPSTVAAPGGESLAAVSDRVVVAVMRIAHDHRGQTVVIVGHDSINRLVLLHALGLPLSRYRYLSQDTCGISEIDYRDDDFYVLTMNETYHLRCH